VSIVFQFLAHLHKMTIRTSEECSYSHLKLSPTAWSSCLKCHSKGSLFVIITCASVWKCQLHV